MKKENLFLAAGLEQGQHIDQSSQFAVHTALAKGNLSTHFVSSSDQYEIKAEFTGKFFLKRIEWIASVRRSFECIDGQFSFQKQILIESSGKKEKEWTISEVSPLELLIFIPAWISSSETLLTLDIFSSGKELNLQETQRGEGASTFLLDGAQTKLRNIQMLVGFNGARIQSLRTHIPILGAVEAKLT